MATYTTTTARSVAKAVVALVLAICLAISMAACAKEFKATEWYGDFYALAQPVNATDGDVRDASDIISGDAPTLQFRCEGENTVMRLETTGFTATNNYNRVVVDIDVANKDGSFDSDGFSAGYDITNDSFGMAWVVPSGKWVHIRTARELNIKEAQVLTSVCKT